MKTMHAFALGLLAATLAPAAAQDTAAPGNAASDPSPIAEAYFQFLRGRMLETDGRWDAALDAYQDALSLDPTRSSLYSEIAASYARRGEWRNAVDYANRAVNVDPDNLDAHRILSGVYTSLLSNSGGQDISAEYVESAIEALEHVVRLSPEETEAYLMLGRLYRTIGEPERALAVYRDFLQVEPGSEEGVIALAELQLGAGNVDEAIELLEGFLAGEPESSAAWIVLGQSLVQIDALERAAEALEAAAGLGRDEIELHRELARILFVIEDWDRSAAKYAELAEREPDDPVSWLRLGQIEQQRMNYAEARGHMERAERLVPGSPDIGFAMAMLDRDEGLFEDAIVRLRQLLDSGRRVGNRYTDTERGQRRLFLGRIASLHTRLEEYEAAVAAFEEMKAFVRPADGMIDAYIVDVYRSAGQPERALEKARSSLEVFSGNFQLRLQYADLLGRTGRSDDGVALLEDMLDGADSDYEIYATMVGIREGGRQWDRAEALIADMLDLFPDRRQYTHFLEGAVLERQLRHADAEQAFRRSLDIDPEQPAVLNYLGYMLADNGEKLEEALEMIRQAVEADPINGAYLDSLGWVYYRLEQFDLAEEYLRRAVVFSSTDPTLHEHLGDLYRRLGRFDDARNSYARSLELAETEEERSTVQEKLDAIPQEP